MGETLIYVDDDALRQEALAGRLRHLGYHVLTANDGADALKVFSSSHVDLAIVDYYMPEMSGDLLAMEMKNRKPNVPVIIFSGRFTLAEMVIAFVDGFVSTSDDPEALINKIAEILGPRRAERAS
jgi:DNA-binding NtrC family response regulator